MKPKLKDNEIEKLKKINILILNGLETLKQFNKKSYGDLAEIHSKFNNVSLPVVIVKKIQQKILNMIYFQG